jgi:hypothetical protein
VDAKGTHMVRVELANGATMFVEAASAAPTVASRCPVRTRHIHVLKLAAATPAGIAKAQKTDKSLRCGDRQTA